MGGRKMAPISGTLFCAKILATGAVFFDPEPRNFYNSSHHHSGAALPPLGSIRNLCTLLLLGPSLAGAGSGHFPIRLKKNTKHSRLVAGRNRIGPVSIGLFN